MLVASARRSLREWRILLYPSSADSRPTTGGPAGLAQLLVPVILFPFYLLMTGLEKLYGWIEVHVSLRAEFLADEMAARTASTPAALSLLRKIDASTAVDSHLTRVKAARQVSRKPVTLEEGAALWPGLREYVASIPDHEFVRQERASVFRGTSIDASHPADYLRSRLLKERSHYEAAVTVSEEEWKAVDRELAPYLAVAGRHLIGWI